MLNPDTYIICGGIGLGMTIYHLVAGNLVPAGICGLLTVGIYTMFCALSFV